MEKKINPATELKTLQELGDHFPRRERTPEGNIIVGVDRSTVYKHIREGRLKLDEHWLKGHMYFYVPAEDQLKDGLTWDLEKHYKARRRGRPSNAERIGLK